MPAINVNGASGQSSQILGAKFRGFNNNLQKMQDEAAAAAAMQSANPYLDPRFKAINKNIQSMMEREASKAAAEAKDAMSSTIPWMNPTIKRINDRLKSQMESEAKSAAALQQKEFKQNATFAKSMAAVRERTMRSQYQRQYQDATAENQARSRNDPNTYRMQNAGRLGFLGQRSAERGNWRELHASERELNTLDKRFGDHPGVRAAIQQARARINAGKEGQSPWRLRMGSKLGAVQDFAANPALLEGLGAAGIAAGLVYETLKAPLTIARGLNSIVGLAKPYTDVRLGMAGLGRAGGFNSRDLEQQLLPDSGPVPDWMKSLGLDAGTATKLLQQYGIAPTSTSQATTAIKSIGGAEFMPGLGGLGMAKYASMANTAANMGVTATFGLDDYFRMMQKVTTTAVAQGMDRSQSIDTVQNLLRQAAASGSVTLGSGEGMATFWNRMVQSGLPGMRTGEGIMSAMAGATQVAQGSGFGGESQTNTMVASYVQRHGGTKAFESRGALEQLFGKDAIAAMDQSPGGKTLLENVYSAAKTGNSLLLNNALQPLLTANPTAMQNVFAGSMYNIPGDPYNFARQSRMTGFNQTGQAAYNSNSGQFANPDMQGRATGIMGQLMKDFGLTRDQAAGIVSNLAAESGLQGINQKGVAPGTGGFGWGQWTGPRRRAFMSWAAERGLNPASDEANYGFLKYELETNQAASLNAVRGQTTAEGSARAFFPFESGGDPRLAYHEGDHARYANQFNQAYAAAQGNDVTQQNAMTATAGQASIGAGKAVTGAFSPTIGGAVGDSLVAFSNVITRFDGSIGRLGEHLDKFTRWMDVKMGTGATNPPPSAPSSSGLSSPKRG